MKEALYFSSYTFWFVNFMANIIEDKLKVVYYFDVYSFCKRGARRKGCCYAHSSINYWGKNWKHVSLLGKK